MKKEFERGKFNTRKKILSNNLNLKKKEYRE